MCLRVLSKCFLNSVWLGAMTASLGSLFHYQTNFLVKNFFLISSLNFPCHNFKLFPCALLLVTRKKRSVPASPLRLMMKL